MHASWIAAPMKLAISQVNSFQKLDIPAVDGIKGQNN